MINKEIVDEIVETSLEKDNIKDIFSNINDWLKFAEAKSATLIACNGALIFVISILISSFEPEGPYLFYLIVILCIELLKI